MLSNYLRLACVKGIPRHKRIAWVKKQIREMHLEREKKDGSVGSSFPCVFCKKQLVRFDIKVHCVDREGDMFHGKMDTDLCPESTLTSGQARKFGRIPLPRRE